MSERYNGKAGIFSCSFDAGEVVEVFLLTKCLKGKAEAETRHYTHIINIIFFIK